jgi:hypothetical protein
MAFSLPLPLQPITAAQVLPHFMADYCLRCGTMFRDWQPCPIVKGGPAAKYRHIALIIDEACLADAAFDVPVLLSIYRLHDPTTPPRTGFWPRYIGQPPLLQGFAKVSMLDNGLAFVGLHRGHVEHWRLSEVRTQGGGLGSYSEDYGLYGGPGQLYHQVIETRFYDLGRPIPPEQAMTPMENRFIRGAMCGPGVGPDGARLLR